MNSFLIKPLAFTLTMAGLIFFLPTQAQNLSGKWKKVGVKQAFLDKSTNRRQDVSDQASQINEMFTEEVEFQAPNTFSLQILSAPTGKKLVEYSGTYELNRGELTFHVSHSSLTKKQQEALGSNDPKQLPTHIFIKSLGAASMVWKYSVEFTEEGHAYISEFELELRKI